MCHASSFALSFPPPRRASDSDRWISSYGVMTRRREQTLAFFTRLASGLGRKQLPATVPLSKSLASPAPQTSLGTSSCIRSPDRVLTCFISFPQFSNYQTSSSFPSSLMSPRTHDLPATMLGYVLSILGGSVAITISKGCDFYDR